MTEENEFIKIHLRIFVHDPIKYKFLNSSLQLEPHHQMTSSTLPKTSLLGKWSESSFLAGDTVSII